VLRLTRQVDAHTCPGAPVPGNSPDEQALRAGPARPHPFGR